jgi:4-aminobutyrate aminotransferase / (S)-3-amino-2-methylpropionate transaminase / 5-aminovalerate transaminase
MKRSVADATRSFRSAAGALAPRIVSSPPGPRSRQWAARARRTEPPAFEARRRTREKTSGSDQSPIVYARGDGSNVTDVDGNRYVDLTAGFGALLLGHRPKAITAAVSKQDKKLVLALGDVYASEPKIALIEALAALYPAPHARVFLGLSGADAITAAMKTAVLATGKPNVVAFEGAYHGLSYAPLAACGLDASFRTPFESQLLPFVRFAPYPASEREMDRSLSAVHDALSSGDCGAVLVEPILGRGGCVVPPRGFLLALRKACDASGALLIADEIWTGLGRSGAWLSSVDEGITADVVCLGKGLGGGLPVSACIGSDDVMRGWDSRGGGAIHTATHFGAPLSAVAALTTLKELSRRKLVDRSARVGTRWAAHLGDVLGSRVREVRGKGLMVGIALDGGAAKALSVARALLGRGYIVLAGGTAGDVLTLTPALNIDEKLLSSFADSLSDLL